MSALNDRLKIARLEATKIKVQKLLSEGEAVPGDLLYDLEIEKLPMLAAPIFPKVGIVGFVGSSDVGKSAFLRQFAMAISSGSSQFLGAKLTPTHGRALYVTTEDDHYATSFLLRKQSKNNREALRNIKFVFDSEDLAEYLDFELEVTPADCVIIDAYSDVLRGDMNQANNVRAFLNEYSRLAVKHECLFIFLHHTGKGKQNFAPSKDNVLGSQGFEAKMRVVIEFRADPQEANLRHLCIVKGNYVKAEDKTKSYILRFGDDMNFNFTGERSAFEDIQPLTEGKGLINNQEVIKQVCALRATGLSVREVTEELSKLGIALSKTSVGKIIKHHESTRIHEFGEVEVNPQRIEDDTTAADNLGYLNKFMNL